MKKFFVLVVALMVTGIMFAETKAVVSPAKTVVTTETVVVLPAVLSAAQWDKVTASAVKLNNEGKYLEAADAYIAAGEIAKQVKDGYSESRLAWMLNNAAYMIIDQYKIDGKAYLSKAKILLYKASGIATDSECKRCIKSNQDYITYAMSVSSGK